MPLKDKMSKKEEVLFIILLFFVMFGMPALSLYLLFKNA
jgi:hypothetical protein